MINILIDSKRSIQFTGEQEVRLRQILGEPYLPILKHQKVCDEARIGRFVPTSHYRPFALRAVALEVFDRKACMFVIGSWYECYVCHMAIAKTFIGPACEKCGAKRIPNFTDKLFKR